MPLHLLLDKIESERNKDRSLCDGWEIDYPGYGFPDRELQWKNAFDECFPEPALPVSPGKAEATATAELTPRQKKLLEYEAMWEEDVRNGMELMSFDDIDSEVSRLRGNTSTPS